MRGTAGGDDEVTVWSPYLPSHDTCKTMIMQRQTPNHKDALIMLSLRRASSSTGWNSILGEDKKRDGGLVGFILDRT